MLRRRVTLGRAWSGATRSIVPGASSDLPSGESPPPWCEQQRAASGRYPSMVFTEYVVVLGLVVLTVGLAIYALGVPLVHAYYLTKLLILLPIP